MALYLKYYSITLVTHTEESEIEVKILSEDTNVVISDYLKLNIKTLQCITRNTYELNSICGMIKLK